MRILDYCRTSAISSLVAAALVTAGLGSAIAGDPTGDWLVADGVAKVRVAECKGRMWGAISWEKEPGVDSNNADHAKQARPTLGMPLLFDMKKKANEDLWGRGRSTTRKPPAGFNRPASVYWTLINSRSRVACSASYAAAKPGPAPPPNSKQPVQRSCQHRAEGRHGQDRSIEGCAQDHRSKVCHQCHPADRSCRRYLLLPDIAGTAH